MKSRQRLRATSKWMCTAAAVLLGACYIANFWYDVRYVVAPLRVFILTNGAIGMTWPAQPMPPGSVVLGWSLEPRVGPFIWWWAGQNRRFGMVLVPLWIPVLAASGSAALLWRSAIRDRRRWLVGHCASCGYDRHGLAAGAACPECGAGKTA